MTIIKSIRFLHLLAYLVITSQLMFYFFVMGSAMKRMSMANFIELRKIVNPLVHQRHIPVYYACLALSIIAIVLLAKDWKSPLFFSAVIALVSLVLDIVLAQAKNGPINAFISTHSSTAIVDWEGMRDQWLYWIKVRGVISTAGFVSLLGGLLWPARS
jgi:uncharacterized membrane protein